MIIVLIRSGKRESCDTVTVRLFTDADTAEAFCRGATMLGKYWTLAHVVSEGEDVDVDLPDYEIVSMTAETTVKTDRNA